MSIEKLKGSLLSEAQKEAEGILANAHAQAQKLLEQEHFRIAALKAEAEKHVEQVLQEQRNERMAWSRLESKRILAEAREDAIKNIMEDFVQSLSAVRKSPEYKRFLKSSVEKAIAEIKTPALVHVVPEDKDILPKIKGVSVVEDLDGLGGAIIERSDGKVRINFSLETLIESRKDDLRRQIGEKLFGGKE